MGWMHGALIGVGVASAAACAVGLTLLSSTQDIEPNTLDGLEDTSKNEYKGKVGKKYEYLLVDPSSGQGWWNTVYEQLKKVQDSDRSDEFKDSKVKVGFAAEANTEGKAQASGSGAKALNEVCRELYKKNPADVDPLSSDSAKKNLARDLFKFCSVVQNLPTAADGDGSTSEVTNSDLSGEKQKLISASSDVNGVFWDRKESWFGRQTITDNSSHFHESKRGAGGTTKAKTLKELCSDAYKSGSGTPKPSKDDVVKYCSFDTETPATAST